MPLQRVFPRTEILAAVPEARFQIRTAHDLEQLPLEAPNTVVTYGFAAGDHILASSLHDVELQALAGAVQAGDPLLIRHIEAVPERPVLFAFQSSFRDWAGDQTKVQRKVIEAG